MDGAGRVALGAAGGAALAGVLAPLLRGFFSVPTGGIGAVTVAGYPKAWDYAVVALLVLGAFAGGAIVAFTLRRSTAVTAAWQPRRGVLLTSLVVFVLMLFLHDHPYALMDPFHEGEHLTTGDFMRRGERPYRDFYVLHGLATDAGLDALALSLGDHPSPLRVRRQQTILDAATLALLVPIAAELTATTAGMLAGTFVTLCGAAAFWLPVFPYFRLGPFLLAVLGLLRFSRTGRIQALLLAFASATLGLLWSLDTGSYALAGVVVSFALLRLAKVEASPRPWSRVALAGAIALALPVLVLLFLHADIRQFLVDSFVITPRAIDAVWSLTAPPPFTASGVHYYLPPVLFGLFLSLAVLAFRRGDRALAARLTIVAVFSVFLFRTASGRVSWSHTRFAAPLLGLAVVAFLLEPLWISKKRIACALLAVPVLFYFEAGPNVMAGAKLLAGWRARQRHEGLVPYPVKAGRGIYASPDTAADLAGLAAAIDALGAKDATILDFSNERALYYLLERRSPIRCPDIPMLSHPPLLAEAMGQLNAHPPIAVIVSGYPDLSNFDGVPNRVRVPDLALWIDANYPKRTQIGRFVLATR